MHLKVVDTCSEYDLTAKSVMSKMDMVQSCPDHNALNVALIICQIQEKWNKAEHTENLTSQGPLSLTHFHGLLIATHF